MSTVEHTGRVRAVLKLFSYRPPNLIRKQQGASGFFQPLCGWYRTAHSAQFLWQEVGILGANLHHAQLADQRRARSDMHAARHASYFSAPGPLQHCRYLYTRDDRSFQIFFISTMLYFVADLVRATSAWHAGGSSNSWFCAPCTNVAHLVRTAYRQHNTSTNVYAHLQIYVAVVPRSVKSPLVILTHHVISALYLLIPYHYPQV